VATEDMAWRRACVTMACVSAVPLGPAGAGVEEEEAPAAAAAAAAAAGRTGEAAAARDSVGFRKKNASSGQVSSQTSSK